jgi:hypothetical protein
MSIIEPVAKATTSVMGRLGQSSAAAGRAVADKIAATISTTAGFMARKMDEIHIPGLHDVRVLAANLHSVATKPS